VTTILAALALALPVQCAPSESLWERQLREGAVPYMALAFYDPGVRIMGLRIIGSM
jgi:hypothetical protein